MFTMLVGMATYFMAIGFIIFEKTVIAAALFFASRKHSMNSVWWAVGGLLLDFWTLLLYFWIRHKMKNRKCANCSAKLEESAKFCVWCGNPAQAIDDKIFLKRFILCIVAVIAALSVIGGVFSAIVG